MTLRNSRHPNSEEELLLKSEEEGESSGRLRDMAGIYQRFGSNGTRRRLHESQGVSVAMATELDGLRDSQSSSDEETDLRRTREDGRRGSLGKMSGIGSGRYVISRARVSKRSARRTCARCLALASSAEVAASSSDFGEDRNSLTYLEPEDVFLQPDGKKGASQSSIGTFRDKEGEDSVGESNSNGGRTVSSSTPSSKYTLTSSEGVKAQWREMRMRESKGEVGDKSSVKKLVYSSTETKRTLDGKDIWTSAPELVKPAPKSVFTRQGSLSNVYQKDEGRDDEHIDLPQQEICIQLNPPLITTIIHRHVRCEDDQEMHSKDQINRSMNRRIKESKLCAKCKQLV